MRSLPGRLFLLSLSLLFSCVHSVNVRQLVTAIPEARDIVFHDVSVFTGTSRELELHQDVRTHADSIVSIAPTIPAAEWGATVRLIEGAGKTLMPGLVDAHGHPTATGAPYYYLEMPSPEHNLEAHLYSGVTTVFEPGGDPEVEQALVKKIAAGELLGPRWFYAGRFITRTDGYPVSMMDQLLPPILKGIAKGNYVAQVNNAEEAVAAAKKNLEMGATFLKVDVTQLPATAPRLSLEEIQAVTTFAHSKHVLVVAHVDSAEDALLATRGGVDALWHNVQLDALTDDQVSILKSLKAVAPTLHPFDVFEQFVDGTFVASPMLEQTESPGVLKAMKESGQHLKETPPELLAWIEALKKNQVGRRANLKKLSDAGITILVGTDANGSDGSFPAHMSEEMQALSKAGMSNADVLLGATSRPATFMFGEAADFGSVVVGKRADLLLLDGNPLEDMAATSKIANVMSHGKLLERNTTP